MDLLCSALHTPLNQQQSYAHYFLVAIQVRNSTKATIGNKTKYPTSVVPNQNFFMHTNCTFSFCIFCTVMINSHSLAAHLHCFNLSVKLFTIMADIKLGAHRFKRTESIVKILNCILNVKLCILKQCVILAYVCEVWWLKVHE